MQEILGVAFDAMQQDVGRLEQISKNLANVTTPGYKRQIAVGRSEFASQVDQLAQAEAAQRRADGALFPERSAPQVARDLSAGTLRTTGRGLDLAVAGDGYFEVETASGPAYTRLGQFRLDAQGRLVTMQGHPVQGMAGEITLASEAVSIDASGDVRDNGRLIDRIKLVTFEAGHRLKQVGDGLLVAHGAMPASVSQAQVRQGFLENSNVQQHREMVALIETMRRFETLQKVVQGYDSLVGLAIKTMGEG